MKMTSRSLFARLTLATIPALVSACATDPADPGEPMPEEPMPEEPMPEQPMPEQPMPIAAGTLDPAFGTGGIKPLEIGAAYAAALDAQGDKLIACATVIDGAAWVARVFRFDAAGALDTGFGTEGRATIAELGGAACRDVVVLPDGHIVVHYRKLADGTSRMTWLTADGATTGGGSIAGQGLGPKLDVYPAGATWGATVGFVVNNLLQVGFFTKSLSGGDSFGVTAESVVRVFRPSVDDMSAVTRIDDGGAISWQVVTKTGNTFAPLGAGARATAGDADTPDLLADAIRLPDGSWFAVGGVDSGLEVMAARFVDGASNEVFVEHHTRGGVSSAAAVTLDGADRPIVVGKATEAGKTVFAWQRYEASSATLDLGYQIEGLASAAAPSGQGELVDVVRLGGALYAIGSYDVETVTPKVALVKIAE